jgi:CubicO group peptidase (beta-lactamase class C family)
MPHPIRRSLLLLCTLLPLSHTGLNGEEAKMAAGYRETADAVTESIAQLCEATSKTGVFSGAVLVAKEGSVLFKQGFGPANREWNTANTPDTKFRLASVSKPFCSILVLQLVQEGKLNLDDKISDWLPNYRKDTGQKITIHHLLSHQGGIQDFTASFNYRGSISRLPFSKDEFIEKHCSNDLAHEPGTIYSYCNAGYIILGRIVEKVTRRSFEQNLRERILDRLDMADSGYDRNRYILPKRANGYTLTSFGYENAQYLDMDSSPGPAGSLYSTVEDLFRFSRGLRTDQLLEEKYRKLMFTPNQNVPEVKAAGGRPKSTYGYGWNIFQRTHPISKHRVQIISHGGAINGFRAMMSYLPEDDIFVVILCNQADPNGSATIWNSIQRFNRELINIATRQPYRLPAPAPVPQEKRMYNLIKTQGLEAALKWYEQSGKQAAWGGTHHAVAQRLLSEGMSTEGLALLEADLLETPNKVWLIRKAAQANLDHGFAEKAMEYALQGLKQKPEDTGLLTIKLEAQRELGK